MRKFLIHYLTIVLCTSFTFAQEKGITDKDRWIFNAEGDFYFTEPFFILPVISADKNQIHLEARYNYEELKTFSGWIGYNISGGDKFVYTITPMAGFIAGRITGFAPGLKLGFNFRKLELYNESEYVFDTNNKENNFFYSWTDFTYSPAEWVFLGFSIQRTKVYKTEFDIQRGLLTGVSYRNFEMSAYYFNPGTENNFFLLSLSSEF